MVWQYKSSPGALQLVDFPVPQLLMEAPEQEDPGFSHPPASPSFSFAVESFYSYSILVVLGGKFASPCIGWTMVGALPLCRRFDLCFSVKRSRLKSLMAARFIGNQSLCGWSCFSAAVALWHQDFLQYDKLKAKLHKRISIQNKSTHHADWPQTQWYYIVRLKWLVQLLEVVLFLYLWWYVGIWISIHA